MLQKTIAQKVTDSNDHKALIQSMDQLNQKLGSGGGGDIHDLEQIVSSMSMGGKTRRKVSQKNTIYSYCWMCWCGDYFFIGLLLGKLILKTESHRKCRIQKKARERKRRQKILIHEDYVPKESTNTYSSYR
eukprot:UN16500